MRALERAMRKLEARELRLLERDDTAVRAVLEQKGPIEGLMALDGATDADELLWFVVEKLKLADAFAALAPAPTYQNRDGKTVERRTMYSPLVLNLLGLISRFVGLGGGPDVQAGVLADERWMGLLGFNGAEVREGATARSQALTGQTRPGARAYRRTAWRAFVTDLGGPRERAAGGGCGDALR